MIQYQAQQKLKFQGWGQIKREQQNADVLTKLELAPHSANWRRTNTGKSIYFDPFGFVAFVVQNRIKPYLHNDDEIQDIETSSCGFYCIGFIIFLHDKIIKYDAFIHIFKLDTIKTSFFY